MTWTSEMREKAIEKKKKNALKNALEKNLYLHSNHLLKKILITAGRVYKCDICKLTDWNRKAINLDLDHIDGDSFNNKLENLRFLCPNCHSQTKTYKGRNINTGKKKVSDKELLNAIKKHKNIRQALISVKLSPRGANYSRALRLTK
ncbi:MAG: HNH endonuclease [Proteobacteria bacterium]|nr:HNH endonuclease [Pseudomonadota bacterium]